MTIGKHHYFLQQIDKAAKILDLLGDFPHAYQVLESILDDPEIDNYLTVKLETLAFLADICAHLQRFDEAQAYVDEAERIDLNFIDYGLMESSLEKLAHVKTAIDNKRQPVKTHSTQGTANMNDIPKAENLADMIQYQDGSVVSRTLLEKKSGTVTLFAFDQGQGLSEHSTPFDAMVQVLDGQAEIKISGQPYTVHQGQMLVMPANKPHALKAVQPFKMLLTMIKSQ